MTGLADTGGLGYDGGALVLAAGLLILVALYYWTQPVARGAILGGVRSDSATGARPWAISSTSRSTRRHCLVGRSLRW